MPEETVHVAELRFDPQNARVHPKQNLASIEHSLQETGAGRSILLANDGTILAGNATVEVAAQVGLENVRIIESDGTQLIAVKRTDIPTADTPMGVKAALYDNYSGELAEWDNERLQEFRGVPEYELESIFSQGFLNDLDHELPDMLAEQDGLDPENEQRVKRWTLQFSPQQFVEVKAILQRLVDSNVVTKTSDNSDVFGNAAHYVLTTSGL